MSDVTSFWTLRASCDSCTQISRYIYDEFSAEITGSTCDSWCAYDLDQANGECVLLQDGNWISMQT